MTNTITFKWATGNIEIAACAVLDMTATQLKTLVKTATANAEEVKNQIADYIQSEIDKLNPKSEYDKKMIAQYNKLISAACGERKQTAQEKAIARILKNVPNTRESFMGIIEDAGKYCVLDGFRLVRFSTPFDGFPTVNTTFDTNRAIGDKSRYNIKLELPTVKNLKADMKIAKLSGMDVNRIHVIRKGKRLDFGYDFGYGMPMVNAKWLIDMIEALPDAAAYAVKDYSCNPIYFTDGENDGILLPIRKMKEYESAPTVEEKAVETAVEKPIEKPVEAAAPAADVVEPQQDAPKVKNLSQLKKALSAGYAFKIVNHYIKPELTGQIRKPNKVQTNAVYTIVPGEPNNPVSLANDGKGYYLNFGKASDWDFTGETIKMVCKGNPVWEITFDLSYPVKEEWLDIDFEAVKESLASGESSAFVERVIADAAAIEEQEERDAADIRVAAVAHVVNDDNAHIPEYIYKYLDLYMRGMITEEEAKDAILRYTVPISLPAHEEAAQDTATLETIQIAAVIHPAVLRPSARYYRRLQFNISSAKNLLKIPACVCTSLNKYDRMNIPHYRRKTQCQPKPQSDSSVMMPRPP